MNDPQTKGDLIERLQRVQQTISDTVQGLSPAQFVTGTDTAWSAAGYLKHLILSIQPIARVVSRSAEQLRRRFGQPDRPALTYAEVVAAYRKRLDEGVRAEDYDAVVPSALLLPDGLENEQPYLLETWYDLHTKLLGAIENWNETDLDTCQLPHPALGILTIRELLFFTLYHNTLHGRDIEQVSRAFA
ncbi:MAG TPA: DinB family protein [Phototrophicaceae bacterium]|nr:DinB family protein [Phototrophicaceae bacterium]